MNIKRNNSMFTTTSPDLGTPILDENPDEIIFQNQLEKYNAEKEDLAKIEIELIKHDKRNYP